MLFSFCVPAVLLALSSAASAVQQRPFFEVPTLAQIRGILANLEGPIVTTVVQRFSLPSDDPLYQGGRNSELYKFLSTREQVAAKLGRYSYGTLEYAYTLLPVAPDVATSRDSFPPGRFCQDRFFENANLTAFYTETFVPMLNSTSTSFYFHLSNDTNMPGTGDKDAVLALDATLLALLSHRTHMGKAVAEAKFAGNSSQYIPLIKTQNAAAIRVLLTNTTQEQVVLEQADAVAVTMSTAWAASGQQLSNDFQANVRNATQKIFRALIDMTTNVEIQYLLQRL